MLEISPLTWGMTIGFIVLLLPVDLVPATARPHHVGFKEATAWSVFAGATSTSTSRSRRSRRR